MKKIYIFLLIFPIICIGIIVMLRQDVLPTHKFCDTDDPVYQSIVQNADAWLKHFPPVSTSEVGDSLHFEVDGLRDYVVNADYPLSENDILVLYISTQPTWPGIPPGAKGYLVSSSEEVFSAYWATNYDIEYLDNNVYCYTNN